MSDGLVAYIASDAIEGGKSFLVTCNCGRKIPLPRPLMVMICPGCMSSIKPIVLGGNPSAIPTKDPATGKERPYPVQGYNPQKPETTGWLKVVDVPKDEPPKTH